jgi:hypothetical protein
VTACAFSLALLGCSGTDSDGALGSQPGGSPATADVNDAFACAPAVTTADGVDTDCEYKAAPGTGAVYCLVPNEACKDPAAKCPLILTSNWEEAFLRQASHPEVYGNMLLASVDTGPSHDFWPDVWAEIPGAIAADYPGVDPDRVFALGMSLGTDRVGRMLLGDGDTSAYGRITDIYAGLIFVAGCPEAHEEGSPDVAMLILSGTEDFAAGTDGLCKDRPRTFARARGCANPEATWLNAPTDDPWLPAGAPDGSSSAQVMLFGECEGAELFHYRFKDEEHVVSYSKHFDPKVRSTDVAWNWLQGRRRTGAGGVTGYTKACK